MSMQFGGVGSGLPVNDWINALVQNEQQKINKSYTKKSDISTAKATLGTIESKFRMLKTSAEKLTDSNIVSAFDIFNRKKGTSSNSDLATITTNNNASIQTLDLKINSLATSTTAESINNPAQTVSTDTKITDLGNKTGKDGTFSIYVNNKRYEYEIDNDDENKDDLGDLINQINADFSGGEVTAELTAEGKFKLEIDNNAVTDFRLGSSTDTSNFINVAQLNRVAIDPDSETTPDNIDYIESGKPLTGINYAGKLVGNEVNLKTEVTEGTFTIGKEEFTVTDQMTLSDLIAQINNSKDANAIATYDTRENKLKITAKDPGALSINIEAGTSNFTEVMGLTSGDSIADGSQTLGKNASVELNGTKFESYSNKLTEDITGCTGVTINLLGTTSETDEDKKSVEINVQQDTEELTNAIDEFIKKFNEVSSEVDKNTAVGKTLHSEYSLVMQKNGLRSLLTSAVDGLEEFDNLAMIGISTGKVGASITDDTNKLTFDKEKFKEALLKNPDEVRTLLIGDKDKNIEGLFEKVEAKLENTLDIENGYFAAREDSFDSSYSTIEKHIKKQEDSLENYRKRLVQQFSQMDKYISQLQQQSSALRF